MDTGSFMDTREHSCMESHRDTRIEEWKYIECLIDSFGNIISSSCHELLDIETIILFDLTFCGKYEKYWLISLCYEIVIYLWNSLLCSLEKSTTNRYSDTFFCSWECMNSCVWLIEECYVIHHYTGNFECLEESLGPCIAHDDKISWNKKSFESKLVLNLGNLKADSPEEEERSGYTRYLYSEQPLPEESRKRNTRFIVKNNPPTTNDEYI